MEKSFSGPEEMVFDAEQNPFLMGRTFSALQVGFFALQKFFSARTEHFYSKEAGFDLISDSRYHLRRRVA